MSPPMPEFEMPAEAAQPPRLPGPPQAASPQTSRPAHTADAGAPLAAAPPRRSVSWRHVLTAGVIGVVAGALLPGGIQIAERTAAAADQDALRSVVMEYLSAIADGRSADAEAMVLGAVSTRVTDDAVLRAAERIADPEVRLMQIEADAATVEVAYRVGDEQVTRPLTAERALGAWQLTGSLVEPVEIYTMNASLPPRIGGAELAPYSASWLHPGVYRFDEIDDPMVAVSSTPFLVDGDPATLVQAGYEMHLSEELGERATATAIAVAEQCRSDAECTILPPGTIYDGGVIHVVGVTEQFVDVAGSVLVGSQSSGSWFSVQMRIERAGTGGAAAWLCAPLDAQTTPRDPCPAVP